jgi:phosphoribosylanthranilate isomerase
MKLKICGMTDLSNIQEVMLFRPDYLGFIFYPKSPRVVDCNIASSLKVWNLDAWKVGVFVNAKISQIQNITELFGLDVIQLHGNESPNDCHQLAKLFPHLEIWKAFGMDACFRLEKIAPYIEPCTHFLFDTKTKQHGGSGKAFSWDLIESYSFPRPFWLSGGIGPSNICQAFKWARHHPQAYGIDMNSKLESRPGHKSKSLLQQLFTNIEKYHEIQRR